MHRLMRIAALLKENRCSNSGIIVKEVLRITVEKELEIPAVAKEILFPFILSREWNVKLLEPESLQAEFKSNLQKMLEEYFYKYIKI